MDCRVFVQEKALERSEAILGHRLMAALPGSVLRLPPVARNLARKQLKSRYVEKLLEDR